MWGAIAPRSLIFKDRNFTKLSSWTLVYSEVEMQQLLFYLLQRKKIRIAEASQMGSHESLGQRLKEQGLLKSTQVHTFRSDSYYLNRLNNH